MFRALNKTRIIFVLFIFSLSSCAIDFYENPTEYIYRIKTSDYDVRNIDKDKDIEIYEVELENKGSVLTEDVCTDGEVVYMELDHGKSLGKIYCKKNK